jgi:hypothetical protein
MYKYAEIYCGKVRDLRESYLNYTEFCSIFDPTSFWIDVTGVEEIGLDWVMKSNIEVGTYFEAPEEIVDSNTLEFKKNAKLELLNHAFNETIEKAMIVSSLGFRVNAGQRAKNDVDGIITKMISKNLEQEVFMDYDDLTQIITLDEAKTIQLEIIDNGYSIYQQKWVLRNQIEQATTVEEVEAINVVLYMYDFLNGGLMTPEFLQSLEEVENETTDELVDTESPTEELGTGTDES